MAIAVSAGTTTYALAQRLVDIPRMTVVTNSIRVTDVLHHSGRADQTIIPTGGVRTPSEALVGPFAVAALRTVHVDSSSSGSTGWTRTRLHLRTSSRPRRTGALIEAARRLVVVADHTKWGVIGISSVARLDQADVLVTDARLSPEAQSQLEQTVRRLVVVAPTEEATIDDVV